MMPWPLPVILWVIARVVTPIDTSEPCPSISGLFRSQGSVVVIGLLDDVLQEAGVGFRRIGSRPGKQEE